MLAEPECTQLNTLLTRTGDGWTTRVEDAMLHGCIPVLFMDNVVPIFGSIINEDDVYGELGR